MASIEALTTRTGTRVYRIKIRRRGLPPAPPPFRTATPRRLGRSTQKPQHLLAHRALPPAHRHTLAETIDRYVQEVLPHKSYASETMQTLQLLWWRKQVGSGCWQSSRSR
jgi:hypothetical protein